MSAQVHFLAVNYFGSAALPAYLTSLREQDCASWRLSIIDNSNDPKELHRLQKMIDTEPRADVWAAPTNLGYFGGAHQYMLQSGANLATWTVVSNMDVRLAEPAFVRRLLQMDASAPVLAPLVVNSADGRPQNPYLVERPTVGKMRRLRWIFSRPTLARVYQLTAHTLKRISPTVNVASHCRSAVYAPHGSIIPIHQRFFVEGGSLHHPVFLFGEEITVAEQCRRLGLGVMFEPSLRVLHDQHQTTGVWRNRRLLRAQAEAADYGYRLIAGAPR